MSPDTSSLHVSEAAGPKTGATMNKDPPNSVYGCVQLSMELALDDKFAIFRTFDDLNMLHLLILQAELAELRSDLLSSLSRDDDGWDEYRGGFIKNRLQPQTANLSKLYEWKLEKGSNLEKEPNLEKGSNLEGKSDLKKGVDNELRLLKQIREKLNEYSEFSNKKPRMPFNNSF
jgi:hypothetical protein